MFLFENGNQNQGHTAFKKSKGKLTCISSGARSSTKTTFSAGAASSSALPTSKRSCSNPRCISRHVQYVQNLAHDTWLAFKPIALRSVSSLICLAPAVIFCFSGGTPVRSNNWPTQDGVNSRNLQKECRAPNKQLVGYNGEVKIAARDGTNLSLENLGRFIKHNVDIILVFKPLHLDRQC